MSLYSAIAIIPARGGSKGLPGKNVRPFGGLPLIAHSIRCAQRCPEIERCIVSTDSEEIARISGEFGCEVPFLRPPELGLDSTPMLPVLQHAVSETERIDGKRYEFVILLQPTSPFRLPEDISGALHIISSDDQAAGVVAVSVPSFSPRAVCVEEERGYLKWAFAEKVYTRRQDAAPIYRINGLLYVWRREYLMRTSVDELYRAPHRVFMIPEERALDIDCLHDFQVGEALLQAGILELPWCEGTSAAIRHS